MNKPVLVHADINKRTEVSYIGYGPFKQHARHQIADLLNSLKEVGRLEFRARISTGLLKLCKNILDRWQTYLRRNKVRRVKAADKTAISDSLLYGTSFRAENSLNNSIRFGMHRRGVKRIGTIHDAQKSCGLLETLLTEA